MATESIMPASVTISKHAEPTGVILTLTNAFAGTLFQGQEVIMSANLSVTKRTTGTQLPIGVVTVGKGTGERVSVFTAFQRTVKGIAKGGTIAAGATVKPNGNWNTAIVAEGLPEYTATAAGDYVSGVVISGGAVDTVIEIGILRTPYQLN